MKIAAIDLGSNSIHMVIVEAHASGGFRVIGREKEMVRLGARTPRRGTALRARPWRAAWRCCASTSAWPQTHGVGQDRWPWPPRPCARPRTARTSWSASAARSASGRGRSRARRRRGSSTWPRCTASTWRGGARWWWTSAGAASSWPWARGERSSWAASEKLGVLRLAERSSRRDPLSRARTRSGWSKHVEKVAGAPRGAHPRSRLRVAIGTSGTILALGALAHAAARRARPGDAAPRRRSRADAIHAAAQVARAPPTCATRLKTARHRRVAGRHHRGRRGRPRHASCSALGVEELILCEWALREGILLDYIHGHPRSLARAEAYPDVRRRSVVALAERCQYDETHARTGGASSPWTSSTARASGTAWATRERALLEYAALLHDIGHHISYPGHHKHTYYLIKNGDLRGFTPAGDRGAGERGPLPPPRPSAAEAPGASAALPRERAGAGAGAGRAPAPGRRPRPQPPAGGARPPRSPARGGSLRVRGRGRGDCELELWGVAAARRAPARRCSGVPVKVRRSCRRRAPRRRARPRPRTAA